MKLIYSKFESQNILWHYIACKKWNDSKQASIKLEEAVTSQKHFQTSGTKKKPSWCVTNEIDSHLVVLDSVNFYFK